MATIQIRHVPEHVHRIYRMRAAASGMSLQEYLLAALVANAALRSPSELVGEAEAAMRMSTEGFATAASAEVVRSDRESH